MAIELNSSVQFSKFVDFAAAAMRAGDSKAIARMGPPDAFKLEGALDTRTITAATGDRVGALKRSAENKAANNDVRALFKQAVIDIFGSEAKIPQSVQKAMLLKDYDVGKPLTARRIMAVQKAITEAVDPVCKKVSRSMAEACVQKSVAYIDAKLSGDYGNRYGVAGNCRPDTDTLARAADYVARYGSGFSTKGLQVFSNYVVNTLCLGDKIRDPDATIQRIAQEIKPIREFHDVDGTFDAMNAKITEYSQKLLEKYMAPEKDSDYNDDGIYNVFIKDSNRANFTIQGEAIPHGDGQGVQDAFKAAVKPEHRKAISAFCCQMSGGALVELTNQLDLSIPGSKSMSVKGTKGLQQFIQGGMCKMDGFFMKSLVEVTGTYYDLQVSEDGTSATLTVDTKGALQFAKRAGKGLNQNRPCGDFSWTQKIEFDLSGQEPRITNVSVSQTLD